MDTDSQNYPTLEHQQVRVDGAGQALLQAPQTAQPQPAPAMPVRIVKQNIVQSAPAPQRRCQVSEAAAPQVPSTNDDTAEMATLQAQADKFSGRLRVTSWVFVAVGAIGAVAAVAHGIGARHAAERDLARPHRWGGQRGGPHNKHGEHHQGPPRPSETISRDELAVLENLRVMALLAFIACAALVRAGFKTLSAVSCESACFTGCVLQKNTKRFGIALLLAVFIYGFGENTRHIIEDHHARHAEWAAARGQGPQEGPRRFRGGKKAWRKAKRAAKKAAKKEAKRGRGLATMEPEFDDELVTYEQAELINKLYPELSEEESEDFLPVQEDNKDEEGEEDQEIEEPQQHRHEGHNEDHHDRRHGHQERPEHGHHGQHGHRGGHGRRHHGRHGHHCSLAKLVPFALALLAAFHMWHLKAYKAVLDKLAPFKKAEKARKAAAAQTPVAQVPIMSYPIVSAPVNLSQ